MSVERGNRYQQIIDRVVVPGFVVAIAGSVGIIFDSMFISPDMQARAEHPSLLTHEQKGAFERYVLGYKGTVVRLADEGKYGEIPVLAEAPELISARQQLANDERVSTLRIERRGQIIADEFIGPSFITRGRVYLAAMVGGVLAVLSVIPLGLRQDRLRKNNPAQITPTGSA